MILIVLIILGGFLLLLSLIAAAVFVRAGFWGEQDLAEQANAVLAWRPPLIKGEALRNWAATSAEQLARNHLKGKRSGATAIQLAMEIEERAVHALLPLAGRAERERLVTCREADQGLIGVTAPEVFAIVARLRKNLSRFELKRIHELAAKNSVRFARCVPGDNELPQLACPLQGQDQVCRAYAARPLHCRALLARPVANNRVDRSQNLAITERESPHEEAYECTVAQGIELGLTRALRSGGLDASVYELNSALAKTLETTDAAERWAKGEEVFGGCYCLARPRHLASV